MEYKVGDQVETPLGVGTIKEIRDMYSGLVYRIQIGSTSDVFSHSEIEPYHPASSS